jgi:hypothetical protein
MAENISVDDLIASAFEERLLEFERLKEKDISRELPELPPRYVEDSRCRTAEA